MGAKLFRRRVTIEDQPKTPRRAETGGHHDTAATQPMEDAISWTLPAEAYGAGYLLTGTTLAVLGQLVTNQGATDPATQLIAWTKYFCTFVLSLAVQLLSGRPSASAGSSTTTTTTATTITTTPTTESAKSDPAAAATTPASCSTSSAARARKAAWLTVAVGLLDTLSYGLNCLGFALCGSALSMVVFAASGQVFTAITRRLLLRKTMTAGQTAGIGLVVVGLVVRSAGKIREALAAAKSATAATAAAAAATGSSARATSGGLSTDGDMTLGVALIVLSAFGYSLLGCLYEWLSAVRGPAMSHAQVATSTSLIGLLVTTAYQLVYTRPRWRELVVDRMAQRGLSWWPVVRLYGVFGALFTVHGLAQGVVLQRSGATAVGIISAMRASVVAVASGLLFCGPQAPQQCLTPASATSAGIVTCGALLWTLAGPRKAPPSSPLPAPPPPPPRVPPPAAVLDAPAGTGTGTGTDRPPEDPWDHKYGKHH